MRFSIVLVFSVLFAPLPAQANCYRDVVDFAEGICAEFVGLSGETAAEKYSGEIEAKLPGLLKQLADIGGRVDADITRERYTNVLQEDVPMALKEGRECRLEVAKVFFDRICPAKQSSITSAPQPSPWKAAYIADPDGYTNVRSGPGTKYQVVTRVFEGESFTALPGQSNWWQVRTSSGAAGYMHVSRIRLQN